MARNFTREIRKALRPGVNRAVCSLAPYEGREVEYSPRSSHDPQPWLLAWIGRGTKNRNTFRLNGRECHVQTFRYAVVALGGKDGFVVLDTKNGGADFNGVAGTLATGKVYSSRYAATDAAKRLEQYDALPVSGISRTAEAQL